MANEDGFLASGLGLGLLGYWRTRIGKHERTSYRTTDESRSALFNSYKYHSLQHKLCPLAEDTFPVIAKSTHNVDIDYFQTKHVWGQVPLYYECEHTAHIIRKAH